MTQKDDIVDEEPSIIHNQPCPMCGKETLTLTEQERDVPYFGKIFMFSMRCSNCNYRKSDLEAAEEHEPAKYTFEVTSEDDLTVRVVKSASATIRIPRIMTIEPGIASVGFVTNIEGLLVRAKSAIETARDSSDDKAEKKKAKNLLKKLQKVMWGQDKLKIILEDPTGNSAIISEKAVKARIKGAKKR